MCKAFQLHLTMGFPRAPLVLEFLLSALSGALCPADVTSPGHDAAGKFLIWEMPSVGLCPGRGIREVLSFPTVQKGSCQGQQLCQRRIQLKVSKLISPKSILPKEPPSLFPLSQLQDSP